MIIYNSIFKMSVVDVKSVCFGAADVKLKNDLAAFFKRINDNKTTLNVNIVDKKNDEIFYIKNGENVMFIMVTKPKTMKFTSLKYDDLQKCSILYNFAFEPSSALVEGNKVMLDALMAAVIAKHQNIAFVLPVDPVTHKLMHPVMEYLGSKFNKGNIERSVYAEFTNLSVKQVAVANFSPDLDHYDPIGNVVYL